MSGLAWIDGAVVDETEARISILDHGFLYGDSVYEAVRTFAGRPFRLDAHLRRLARSAAGLGIRVPDTLDRAVEEILAASRSEPRESAERLLRIIVTRGVGPLGYEIVPDQKPTLLILSRPLPSWPDRFYTEGVALAIVSVRRNSRQALDPTLKTSNLLNVRLAYMEARRSGADDALLLNARGEVTEASGSNVFIVRDEVLLTPPIEAGILEGITRQLVIEELAPRSGLTVVTEPVPWEWLETAQEIFLTSTTRAIMPVRRVDPIEGRPRMRSLAAPGTVTRQLMRSFEEMVGLAIFPAS